MVLRTGYTAIGLTFLTSAVSLEEKKVDRRLIQILGGYKAPGA